MASAISPLRPEGVITALVTPMSEDARSVDLDAFAAHVERGARLDIRNKQGRTALDAVLRAREHSAAIAAYLRDRSPAPAEAAP